MATRSVNARKGELYELQQELLSSNHKEQVTVLKKIVANMTLGSDMSPLFPDVLRFMSSPMEMKKMAYLFVVTYAKLKPELALLTVNSFLKDAEDINPLIRGLSLRTMSYINVDKINEALTEHLRRSLKDDDAYVRRTAAMCVCKLYEHDRHLIEDQGFIETLTDMIKDPNPTVVANVLASLTEINNMMDDELVLPITFGTVRNLLTALNDCNEWAQTYILEALLLYTPADSTEAETEAQLVGPRLAHASASVVLSSIKLLMHVMPYFSSDEVKRMYCKKMTPPLVTLLHSDMPEIKYVGLRNVLLLIQKRPDILENELKVFFCEYNDPIYVKLAKLEVMMRVVNDRTAEAILAELKEYATEVDVDFVRKAVRAIGITAVKIERAAERAIETLLELIQTKVNYVVQEAIVVIKDIFRKYPNRYESIIGTLCESLDTLDEPEAKASMVWIIGQYSDRIDNAAELLDVFLASFHDEPVTVQLSLLTATVKLFLRRPNESEALIKKVFKWCTEDVNNPDLRDRGFMYWRLLSTDPAAAKVVVLTERPLANAGTYDSMEPSLLNELIDHVGSLASVYHKPPSAFLGNVKTRVGANAAMGAAGDVEVVQRGARGGVDGVDGAGVQTSAATSYLSASEQSYSTPGVSVAGGGVMDLLDLDESSSDVIGGGAADSGAFGGLGGLAGLSLGAAPSQPGMGGFGAGAAAGATTGGTAAPALGFGISQNSVSDMFATAERLVLPKQTFLSAAEGKGLEVAGTFARRNANVYLDLVLSNRAMQAMSDFALQINTNTFGLTMRSPLEVHSPLMPGQSVSTSILLLTTGAVVTRGDTLQIALKNNVSVFYFSTPVPLHVLFVEDAAVDRNDYLRMWREIPDHLENRAEVSGLRANNVAAFKHKLQLNNVFTVAEREADGRQILYCFARTLPDRASFFVEVSFNLGAHAALSALRTTATHLAAPFQATLAAILRHAQ